MRLSEFLLPSQDLPGQIRAACYQPTLVFQTRVTTAVAGALSPGLGALGRELWAGTSSENVQRFRGTQGSRSRGGLGRRRVAPVWSSWLCCGCCKSKPQQVEDLKPDFSSSLTISVCSASPCALQSPTQGERNPARGEKALKEEASPLMDLPRASRGCSSSSQHCDDAPWGDMGQLRIFAPLSCLGQARA